jgi:hypothetical protein
VCHRIPRTILSLVAVAAVAVAIGSGCGSDGATTDSGSADVADTAGRRAHEPTTVPPADPVPGQGSVAAACVDATRDLLGEVVPALRPAGEALPPITSGEQLGEAVLGLLLANSLPQSVASDPTLVCGSDLEYARALVVELSALDATESEQVVDLAHGVFSIGCSTPEESDLSPEATTVLCEGIDARFAARGIDLDP